MDVAPVRQVGWAAARFKNASLNVGPSIVRQNRVLVYLMERLPTTLAQNPVAYAGRDPEPPKNAAESPAIAGNILETYPSRKTFKILSAREVV
jgi:hypothetical protein